MISPTTDHSLTFTEALQSGHRPALAQFPKSDLHNHALLGSRRERLEEHIGKRIPEPGPLTSIAALDQYVVTFLAPHLIDRVGFIYGMGACFQQAREDGVNLLEMSVDSAFVTHFPGRANGLVNLIQEIHRAIAPGICLIPQLGLNRAGNIPTLMNQVIEAIDAGFFQSIDLYGDELCRPASDFREIYENAAAAGWRLCAHAGEFGNAESVRSTVEVLNLQYVQHGIAAANAPDIMQWLADRKVQLNICPSSNVALHRVPSLREHPARRLFDHGVRITLNTDDLMIFGQSIVDEYFNCYSSGLFTARELDIIRVQGLESLKSIP